jgi:Flp pilus assembly protein TadD
MNLFLVRALQAYQDGRPQDALEWCGHIPAAVNPSLTKRLQGLCWLAVGEQDKALAAFAEARTVTPPSDPGWAELNTDYALALHKVGRRQEAVQTLAQAAQDWTAQTYASASQKQQQAMVALMVHWATGLIDLQRWHDAAAVIAQAQSWGAEDQALWNVLGLWRLRQDDPAGSVVAYRKALSLAGQDQPATRAILFGGLGAALFDCGDPVAALAACDQAIALDPAAPDVRMNRAAALLALGRYEEGWQDLEYRWQTAVFQRRYRPPEAPLWDCQAHPGETLLIRCEQAFGDALMIARLLPLTAQRFGGRLVVETHPALRRLFEMIPGVSAVIPYNGPGTPWPAHQWQAGLMSLPRLLSLTPDTVPAAACLPPPQTLSPLPPKKGPAIGLSWGGRAQPRNRSVPLADLWAAVQQASQGHDPLFVCLQADERRTEAAAYPALWLPPKPTDFADSAALIAHLDLVITIDSAVLHLATAQGTPTAALLLAGPDWRYSLHPSPWYPTTPQFRQPTLNAWPQALQDLSSWLSGWLLAGCGGD